MVTDKMQMPLRIALVEDDPIIGPAYHTLIGMHNYMNCELFDSAEAFLQKLGANSFDVVVMDVNLPGTSGIDCTKKAKDKFPALQVLIFTIYENDENVFRALEAGANGYVLKQSEPEFIIRAINEVHAGGAPMTGSIARRVLKVFDKHKDQHYDLTTREKEILELLAEGNSYQRIANKLFISYDTVRTHIYNTYKKLHVTNRIEAINKWKRTQ